MPSQEPTRVCPPKLTPNEVRLCCERDVQFTPELPEEVNILAFNEEG